MSKKSVAIGERSIDTQLLCDYLVAHADDEIVQYDSLSAVIGRDIRNGSRPSLQSARRIVEREHSIVFDVVPTVGLKRVPNHLIPASCGRFTRHIRSTSSRAIARLQAVKLDELPKGDLHEFNLQASFHGAIRQQASQPAQKKLRAAVEAVGEKLPLAKTLALFGS